MIQYPNYEEKSCLIQVKLWNVLQVRNLKNFISLSFPFFAFHYSFIFIFNFSVLRLLQSYFRPLVTSFLRDLKTPWQSGWRIWQNTVSNSVLGEWKFLMDFKKASILWVECCIHQGFLRFHVAHLPLIAQRRKIEIHKEITFWLNHFIKANAIRRDYSLFKVFLCLWLA